MSVLAYSELLKRIAGVDESKLVKPFTILSQKNMTEHRLLVLRELGRIGEGSIGRLLKSCGFNRSGGSYLGIRDFFLELEKEKLLKKRKVGNRSYWSFANQELEVFIRA